MSLPRNEHPVLTLIGSLASIVSLAFIPGLFDWLVSSKGLLLIAVLLGAAVVYLIILLRRMPREGDQKRLDQIFELLPRQLLRSIRSQDYSIPWKDDLIHPVGIFRREFGEVEHRFEARRLEKCRKHLHEAAEAFLDEESSAFDFSRRDGYRFLGTTSGALETASKSERDRFERRRAMLHEASQRFVAAHDALVEEAKQRRFDLDKLESDPLKPSWTGVSSASAGVRAHWPGE